MNQLFRLKDSIMDYISPKRRRTIGPGPLTPNSQGSPSFRQPYSDPQGIRRQETLIRNTRKESWSPSNRNPRKRQREEDEFEFHQARETVGPDDSISQVVGSIGQDIIVLKHREEYVEDILANPTDHNVRNKDYGAVQADLNEDAETDLSNSAELDADSLSEAEVDLGYNGSGKKAGAGSAPGHYEGRVEYEDDDDSQEQLMDSVEDDDDDDDDDDEESGGMIPHRLSDDDDDLEEDSELLAEARAQEILIRQNLLTRRQETISRFKVEGGWHPDAMNVFERLELRSYEAIFPWSWRIDFPTLPELLFSKGGDTFIKENYKSAASGAKALQPLLSLCLNVYEKLEAHVPEDKITQFIHREIQHYVKWSQRDGGFHGRRFIPCLHVHKAKLRHSSKRTGKAVSDQMKLLAKSHRESMGIFEDAHGNVHIDPNERAPPLIYGIIIAQNKVIFMTHDSADPKAGVKLLHHFDLSDKEEGAWNGIAIALLVVAARQYNMSIRDELEIDDDSTTDIDA